MVNKRSKTKKSLKTCFSQASIDHHHSTTSAAFVGSNDDVLTEILLRLPVKSIVRFKSVSQHWRLLLTHSHFTNRYDNNNLSKTPSFFVIFARDTIRFHYAPFNVENQNAPPFKRLDFCNDLYGIVGVQSCNGLLLCCSNTSPHARDYRKYYVFNPTTKQFAIIRSVIGGQRARETICFMGLVFHQTDCVHYKLVCVLGLKRKTDLHQIQIYSSEARRWKIAVESFSACGRVFKNGVYLNGAVYWAPINGRYACFKIDDEKLQMLSLPNELIPFNIQTMYFGESRGHLHLLLFVNHYRNRLNVYEMLGDHSGWFVKYQVLLDEHRAAFPEIFNENFDFYELKVVDVVRGETEEDTFVVLNTKEKIIRYNVHDKSFKLIFTIPHSFENFLDGMRNRYIYGDSYDDFPWFHRYIETLTSL